MGREADIAKLKAAGWVIEPPDREGRWCARMRCSLTGQPWARAKRQQEGFCLDCALTLTDILRATAR